MPTLIQLAKSKTVLFSTALSLLGLVNAYIGVFNLTADQQSYALLAIGIISNGLRFVTTQALNKK
jgi:hypothetical protein